MIIKNACKITIPSPNNWIEFCCALILIGIFIWIEIIQYLYDPYGNTTIALAALMFCIPGVILVAIIIIYEALPFYNPHEIVIYRFFAQMLSLNIIFPSLPEILYISDGGHLENFGFLPLFRRKCRLVVIADGSQDENETCDSLFKGLKMAEGRLHCSFFFRRCPKICEYRSL